jgi:cell division transport system ATP-binding protein
MLKLENVTKSFGSITALSDVSFEMDEGEFVFITGPSGAGKTTLLRLILCELKPDKGKVSLDDQEISSIGKNEVPKLRQNIGVVFQDYKVLPEKTLKENVELALAVTGVKQEEWEKRVDHVLELVGLIKRADLFPSQLSGGELQRVSLARALIVNPKIILADEPTGNIDWETADKIMELFDKVNKEGKTILVATHHKGIVDKMAKRVIKIREGKIEEDSGKKATKSKSKKK